MYRARIRVLERVKIFQEVNDPLVRRCDSRITNTIYHGMVALVEISRIAMVRPDIVDLCRLWCCTL